MAGKKSNVPAVRKNTDLQDGKLAKRKITEGKHTVRGGFYDAGQGKVPDAWTVQMWANENKIDVVIREHGYTGNGCFCVVEAIDNKTGQRVQDIVEHNFDIIRKKRMLDLIDKAIKRADAGQKRFKYFKDLKDPVIFGENGEFMPNLTSEGQLHLIKQQVNFENFAIRDAQSKAMSRAVLKILNKEWREEEEIELEQEEVEEVARAKQPERAEKMDKRNIKKEIKEEEKGKAALRKMTQETIEKEKKERKKKQQEKKGKKVKAELVTESPSLSQDEATTDAGKNNEPIGSNDTESIKKLVLKSMGEIEDMEKPVTLGRITLLMKEKQKKGIIDESGFNESIKFAKTFDIPGNHF